MSNQGDQIRALIAQGRSNGEIARALGARPSYVRSVRHRTEPVEGQDANETAALRRRCETLERDLCDYREQCARHRKRTRELEDLLAQERQIVVLLQQRLAAAERPAAVGRAA